MGIPVLLFWRWAGREDKVRVEGVGPAHRGGGAWIEHPDPCCWKPGAPPKVSPGAPKNGLGCKTWAPKMALGKTRAMEHQHQSSWAPGCDWLGGQMGTYGPSSMGVRRGVGLGFEGGPNGWKRPSCCLNLAPPTWLRLLLPIWTLQCRGIRNCHPRHLGGWLSPGKSSRGRRSWGYCADGSALGEVESTWNPWVWESRKPTSW